MENDAPRLIPETSLREALETLHRSPGLTLPIRDPQTGEVLAVLARQKTVPTPVPPRLGGMATPLGVYLHDGVSSGGAGFWGLFLTGVTMSCLALLAQVAAHGLARAAAAHLPQLTVWESLAPLGVRLWLAAISPWLPLPLVFLLMRLVPLSGTHAAEHQVVHCVERSAPLMPDCVRAMPRVHPRCGTNLFAGFTLFLLTFLAVFCMTEAGGWQLLDGVSLAAMLAGPITLIYWRRVGGWIQQWFATRPATEKQIAGAIFAAEQVLSRRRFRLERGILPRFAPVRRVWAMGFVQIIGGYLAVFAFVSLLDHFWPGLTRWLEM
jgi:hypothetical protein